MKFEYLTVFNEDTKLTLIQRLESNFHIVSATGVGQEVHYVLVDGDTLPQPEMSGVQFDDNSDSTSIEN